MAEEAPPSTQLRMVPLADFASIDDYDFAELVWENGQMFMRGRSTTPCITNNNSHSPKAPLTNNVASDIINVRKRPRLEKTIDSSPLSSGLPDRKEFSKHDKHAQFEGHRPTKIDMFLENINNGKHATDAHVVPVYENLNTRRETASNNKFLREIPYELTPARNSSNNGQEPHHSTSQRVQASAPVNDRSNNVGASQALVSKAAEGDTMARIYNIKPISRPIARPPEEPPPDEQSEAVVPKNNARASKIKGKLRRGNSLGKRACRAATSMCSLQASNNPNCSSWKRSREDNNIEKMACPSENVEEEVGVTTANARGCAASKKKPPSQVHNLSERKRRCKINKKMRALLDLVPNSKKVDKASKLDEAIEYLKTLQLQVQIMSMGSGLCMPPMMLPATMQHVHAPHLTQFPPMGMGMHMGASPLLPSAMLGFPGQMLPMTISGAPFNVSGFSTHPTYLPSLICPKVDAGQKLTPKMMNNTENVPGLTVQDSCQAQEESHIQRSLLPKQ